MNASSRLRIIVLGYIVRCPMGGMAWHHLQYVLGLARLGHDVLFAEDSGDDEWACYDPSRNVTGPDASYGLDFAAATFARAGIGDQWAYHDALRGMWLGPAGDAARETFRTADLVLNLSGSNVLRPWALEVPARAYVDTDPAFTQLRHIVNPQRRERARQHTVFFSFGANFGSASCRIPDDGFNWQATCQPIVLDAWPVTPGPVDGPLTTVLQWDDDSTLQDVPLVHNGLAFGRKRASFEPYMDLPARSPRPLQLAAGGATLPRDQLRARGWTLRDALVVTAEPWMYQDYIRASMAEFGIAKQGYVVSNSGWFSERSACYLASGRPVVVQDTGFATWLDPELGVLRFSTPDEASARLQDLVTGYAQHAAAARAVAERYFASDRVLDALVRRALAT